MAYLCLPGLEGWNCSLFWLVATLFFFISAIARRQLADNFSIDFNLWTALAGSEILLTILTLITHSLKWGFVLGLVGMVLGGLFGGKLLGGGGE